MSLEDVMNRVKMKTDKTISVVCTDGPPVNGIFIQILDKDDFDNYDDALLIEGIDGNLIEIPIQSVSAIY